MIFGAVNRFITSFVSNPAVSENLVHGMVALGTLGTLHQYQQIRRKHMIKWCGFLEPPEFKKRDLRYKTSTKHDVKRMNWDDYQFRRWRAVHFQKQYPLWQSQMDYAENLVRLGMSPKSIARITQLHPWCINYLQRKVDGNVKLLREAHYSNYVNHKSGDV